MTSVQRNLWYLALLQISLLTLFASRHGIFADVNKSFNVSSLCLRDRHASLYRTIDGAVLTSEGESNLDCVITFQTDSILKRFLLRFERLSLDCHDHLAIFDGTHAIGRSKANLSCGSSPSDVGDISTQGNFVTLRYTTDNESPQGSGFKLVITAYRNRFRDDMPNLRCQDFQCNNTLCISSNLTCDGVNHCGDNSDETSHASCAD
ncbi:low-density lipoprotein receptor-related protein 10 [Rhipicephalus sanguineus]|uniref:low-density lipoprotein receptor-related protein 10 n=1 Tax=Rhipicephalus sanguineus TaxID=34632 RepID=UPI001893DF2A|nr:low-density lipoprotein receptor-related protein 10 [Rhipicephalus sanguineus]